MCEAHGGLSRRCLQHVLIVELSLEAIKTRTGRLSPTDPAKAWDSRTPDRKLAALCKGLPERLDIEMFEYEQ